MQARTSSQPLVDPRLTLDIVQQEFPDLPREALVKEDLLRQGIAFSPAALACTAVAKPKSYFIFSFDRVAISEMEAGEHRHLPEEIALAGGPWGFRRTIVSVRLNPESPYRVVAPEGESDARALQLELAGEPIADVILP